MIPRKVGLGGLGKGVRRPLLFRLKAQNQKPATWVSPTQPVSRFAPLEALASLDGMTPRGSQHLSCVPMCSRGAGPPGSYSIVLQVDSGRA